MALAKAQLSAAVGELVLQWTIEASGELHVSVDLEVNGSPVFRRLLNRSGVRDAQALAAELVAEKRALGYHGPSGAAVDGALPGRLDVEAVLRLGQAQLRARGDVELELRIDPPIDVQPGRYLERSPNAYELLACLLAPSRQPPLEALTLSSATQGEILLDPYVRLVQLARATQLRRLEILHSFWQDPADDLSSAISYLGHTKWLLLSLPRLEHLALSATSMTLWHPLEHDELRALSIRAGMPRTSLLRWVMKARLPALEVLELDLGKREGIPPFRDPEYPDDPAELEGAVLPARLSRLRITHTHDGDLFVAALCAQPGLPSLALLELYDAELSDEGLTGLLQHRGKLEALARICLSEDRTSAALRARAQEELGARLSFVETPADADDD